MATPSSKIAFVLACLALLCLAPPARAQETETQVETWPDGSKRIEREGVRGEDGEFVLQGEFKSWFPSGLLESEGRYTDGWRSGLWTTYHENGEKASEGAYKLGLRNTRWKYWDEIGDLDSERSGSYTAHLENYPSGRRRIGGELRGKHQHGEWTMYAPDGTVLARGECRRDRRDGEWRFFWPATGALRYGGSYLRGDRDGPWVFHHPDGTVDPELLSGVYEEDVCVGGLDAAPAPPRDLDALPEASPAPELDDEGRAALAAALERYSTGGQGRDAARRELLAAGRQATPAILRKLRALELTDPAAVQLGFHLNYALLAKLYHGHAFAWRPGVTEENVKRNRLAILRWHSLWESTLDSSDFVNGLPELAEGQPESPRLFQLPFEPFANPTAASEPVAGSVAPLPLLDASERRRLLKKYGGTGTEDALEAALEWLALHQSTDGSWDADGFSMRCALSQASAFCSGGGSGGTDVGVSGLALLAMMGDGSGPGSGPRGEVIQKGIDWLVSRQDAKGFLGGAQADPGEGIYCHALSTLALSRALRAGGSPELRAVIEAAVEHTLSQRLSSGGWRYSGSATENADTSVTGWVLRSLAAARECGIATPPEVEHFALAWLDTMADPKTGRVGYDVAGSGSARISGVNDQFPSDVFETLTSAALYARLSAVSEPEDDALMKKQVSLIMRKLPRWGPQSTDLYGWYHATYAMYHYGGRTWKKWNTALKEALLPAQVQDSASHENGSFPVDTAWGPKGGRVFTTAMAALMLEVYLSGSPRMD